MSNIYIQEPPTFGKVLLHTSCGDIDIELWSKEAPKACRNFVQLVMEGYYDGTIFHRIVRDFIAQCGDPTGTGTGGESIYGAPFKDEFHSRLRFVRRGLVAMANAGPNDNGSQFFFTFDAAPELNKKHTIFGKVVGNTLFNMLKLQDVETGDEDRPLLPPKIISAEILSSPFDDITPRAVKKKRDDEETKKPKVQSKATKNFSLLSFGEEAEEDEEETDKVSYVMRGKSKSSHDLIDDPKLSSVPALETESRPAGSKKRKSSGESEDSENALDREITENVRKKLKKEERPGKRDSNEGSDRRKGEEHKEDRKRDSSRKEENNRKDRHGDEREESRNDSRDQRRHDDRRHEGGEKERTKGMEDRKDDRRRDERTSDRREEHKQKREGRKDDVREGKKDDMRERRKDDSRERKEDKNEGRKGSRESDRSEDSEDRRKRDRNRSRSESTPDSHKDKRRREETTRDRSSSRDGEKREDSRRDSGSSEDRKRKGSKTKEIKKSEVKPKDDMKKEEKRKNERRSEEKMKEEEPKKGGSNTPKSSRSEELRKESRKLQREIAALKHKRSSSERHSEDRKNSESDSQSAKEENSDDRVSGQPVDMLEEYKQERQKYKELRQKQGKKGSRREDETLAILAKFTNKLRSVQNIAEEDSDKGEENTEEEMDDGNLSWMTHKLHFEDKTKKVLDANVTDSDRYEIYDPRNPLTKRRREAGRDSGRDKKSSRDRR